MKKTITLFAILCFVNAFATDRFVDPNLSQGNGTTLFTTITSAVAAAQNGDRIIVVSSTYNEAELTIDKSLQIIPQTAGTTINCNFNIVVSGFPGMNLEIVGFNIGLYEFRTLPISNGDYNNRATVSVIDSFSSKVDFNNNFYNARILNNTTNKIQFRHGLVVNNTTEYVFLLNETQDNLETEIKNKIINNDVLYMIGVYNSDYGFVIANNIMRDISIKRWNANVNVVNEIFNNNFKSDSTINISHIEVPYYNLVFTSNLFVDTFYFASCTCGLSNATPFYYNSGGTTNDYMNAGLTEGYLRNNGSWWFTNSGGLPWPVVNGVPTRPNNFGCILQWGQSSNLFPNLSVPGFVEWSYNGIDFGCNVPDSSSPLSLTKIVGQTNPVNGGHPNHKYYDINLTINDRGINGGPYSRLNYNSSNPNNSRAFIFDLEMPVDIFTGQDIQIKAKGYHSN